MSDDALKLVCVGCGSSLTYSASDRALKCPYCGSTTEIPRAEDSMPSAVNVIVPLRVEPDELEDAVYRYLASGDLTPDHLLDHASIVRKERFYVPAFCFTGNFEATWTASFGYDRTEHYTVMENRNVNGRTQSVPVSKTRTVTDWRPVSGDDTGDFAVMAYAGSRLSTGSLPLAQLFEGPVSGLEDFDSSYTSGFEVEEFAKSDSAIYDARGKALIEDEIKESVTSHAQGDRQKDWHWKASTNWKGVPALVPVCHATYEFEGRQYAIWFSGADTNRRVADDLPVDANRHVAIKRGYLPLYATLVAAPLAIFGLGADWVWPLFAVGGAWLYAWARKKSVVSYSKGLRQWLLARRKQGSAAEAGRPSKPLLANTGNDKIGLPAIAVAACALAIVPALIASQSRHSAMASSTSSYVASSPTPPSEPMSHTPVTSRHAMAQEQAMPRTETTAPPVPDVRQEAAPQATAETPAPGQSSDEGIALLRSSPIAPVLSAADAGNWSEVDNLTQRLAAVAKAPPRGSRSIGRLANQDGLAALKAGDLLVAREAFTRGVAADPADVELQSNLAYVLVKQHDPAAIGLIVDLLIRTPTRYSAWGSLAEATASDAGVSSAAIKLTLRYTPSRDKTMDVLRQIAAGTDNPTYANVAASVLASADDVPTLSKVQPVASTANESNNRAAPVQKASPAPAPANDSALNAAIRQMLIDGEDCYNRKQYTCSLTNATNVLRLRADDPRAQKLQANAQAAQAQAMSQIEIH